MPTGVGGAGARCEKPLLERPKWRRSARASASPRFAAKFKPSRVSPGRSSLESRVTLRHVLCGHHEASEQHPKSCANGSSSPIELFTLPAFSTMPVLAVLWPIMLCSNHQSDKAFIGTQRRIELRSHLTGKEPPPSFTTETVKRTGKSERTVQRLVLR